MAGRKKKLGGEKSAAPYEEAAGAGFGRGDPLILLAESRALEHVKELMHSPVAPEIPEGLEGMLPLQEIHRELCDIREAMKRYTAWDLETGPESRGILPGYLKTLRSNLRHVIWRMQMTLEGDTGARKHPTGKFANIFDGLIEQMDGALRGLREKEAGLHGGAAGLDALRRPAGALNREAFTFRALVELYAAFAQGRQCCLAVAAPDHFKEFDGGPAAAEALGHMAGVFSGQLRKTDFAGRWNEGEFVLFFQEADLEACRGICERILQALAFTPFSLHGKPVHVTASIGIAAADREEFGVNAEDFRFTADNAEIVEELAGRAEEALREAERAGHSRVASFPGGEGRADAGKSCAEEEAAI
jgi:diguanylate cyclase (GGDEF)-like protein